jgi:hypothetical protein
LGNRFFGCGTITAGSITALGYDYGFADVTTDVSGKVYFRLPVSTYSSGEISLTAGSTYTNDTEAIVEDNNSNVGALEVQ